MKYKMISKNKKAKVNRMMIIIEVFILVIVISGLFILYPKSNLEINENKVSIRGINANVVMISENSDFSNPRYFDLSLEDEIVFNLDPGTYYWKADNGIISGFSNQFTIDSEVGMVINRSKEDTQLVNVGNVEINISQNKKGIIVGNVILSPDESDVIEDSGEYVGEEADHGI
ncbi:hypothetical protein GOV12_02700 [Candidatus Pacearchaeota archaeon]|nr:hypothetical protein [Candidatus Pacearchaeota archaeon]